MPSARLNRDARLAILTGFKRRNVYGNEIWEEFAEREGYARPVSILNRIEADFGPQVSIEVGDALAEEVSNLGAMPPGAYSHPIRAADFTTRAVEEAPEVIVPMVLPDELFGRLIEVAWEIHTAADLDAFHQAMGSIYHPPDSEWINTILSKQGAPCRLVNGVIEWTDDDLASEQPLASSLSEWPDLRTELRRIREAFRRAEGPDDYNAIGMRCERFLISLGRVAFDASQDLPDGNAEPGKDDCKQRLKLFFKARATGKRHKAIRKVAETLTEAAYDQAQIVKHGRDADRSAAGVAISSICTLIDLVAAVRSDPV